MQNPEEPTPAGPPKSGAPSASDTAAGPPLTGAEPDGADGADDAEGTDAETGYTDDVTRERDELLEQVRRVQADFENFRKRTQREQAERSERATEGLVEALLPVLDNFELALVGMEDTPESANVRKGVELVFAEFLGALEKAGLERVVPEGVEFDPTEHEAVMTVDVDEPVDSGTTQVVETVRTGYRLKGRVLRPAMVKVAH